MSEFFNWSDTIENDGNDFVTLMPGTYPATVESVEKGRWEHPGKMNGCPTAIVTLKAGWPGQDQARITDTIFLARSTEWRIGQFLVACGLKTEGEPIRIDKIINAKGKSLKVAVICKAGKDHDNKVLNADEAADLLDAGEVVFNNINKYIKAEEDGDSEFGF